MTDTAPPRKESEPTTGPVVAGTPPTHPSAPGPGLIGPPPPPGAVGPPHTVYVRDSSRVNKAAAWVGIAAGSVFVAAVIFGTWFIVGKHAGEGPHGAHEMVLPPGPAMMPMGPRGEFERGPAFSGPFGPGGPTIELPRSPGGPDGPAAPPRP